VHHRKNKVAITSLLHFHYHACYTITLLLTTAQLTLRGRLHVPCTRGNAVLKDSTVPPTLNNARLPTPEILGCSRIPYKMYTIIILIVRGLQPINYAKDVLNMSLSGNNHHLFYNTIRTSAVTLADWEIRRPELR
jgi:hypothetical protein